MTKSLEKNTNTNCDVKIKVQVKIQEKENTAFKLFTEVLQLFKVNEVMLSFNGGKDCTVLLHMLTNFFSKNSVIKNFRLPVLYIQADDSFDEVESFVDQSVTEYNVDFIKRKGNIKDILTKVCEEMPHIKAVFMGSRRTDPYCEKLLVMQATDPGWPSLMRINPIIDWSCRDIWDYISNKKVPYCSLYDLGYTSLGNKSNTIPNPHLKICNYKTGSVTYRPAYEMPDDDSLERAGRIK